MQHYEDDECSYDSDAKDNSYDKPGESKMVISAHTGSGCATDCWETDYASCTCYDGCVGRSTRYCPPCWDGALGCRFDSGVGTYKWGGGRGLSCCYDCSSSGRGNAHGSKVAWGSRGSNVCSPSKIVLSSFRNRATRLPASGQEKKSLWFCFSFRASPAAVTLLNILFCRWVKTFRNCFGWSTSGWSYKAIDFVLWALESCRRHNGCRNQQRKENWAHDDCRRSRVEWNGRLMSNSIFAKASRAVRSLMGTREVVQTIKGAQET
jgi:hypothetical protein